MRWRDAQSKQIASKQKPDSTIEIKFIFHHFFRMPITYRFDPIIPTELELFAIDESIFIFIENNEHLLDFLVRQYIDVTFVIAK